MTSSYIMYLRKSRQDDPRETVEEVLAKHETMLQEYAAKELGGTIPEENIYREVVSGESIEDRVEIQSVLLRIESPDIKGVLVVEPQRLSRGDLEDCGRLISDFRYTSTLVVTPMMVYNLANKMERRFFQDELLRGRDYLEYVKDILKRGREGAARRGCYISPNAPYGYDRVKIGKDWTLEPNDEAEAVKLMFEWYVNEGISLCALIRRLDEYGFRPPQGKKWSRGSIRPMLKNIHYTGKVRYNNKQKVTLIESGTKVQRVQARPEEDVIIVEGKHDAIISDELFAAAQTRLKNTPRTGNETELVNVLAGVLICSKCGRTMIARTSSTNSARTRLMCPTSPQCLKSSALDDVVGAVAVALEQAELPKLQTKLRNGEGDAAVIQKRRLAKLAKQMEEYREQEDKQYELLETGKYTQAVFDRRNAALREKVEQCEKEMRQARAAMPKNVDYAERITTLESAIAALRDKTIPNRETNKLLRSIVERIEYSAPPVGSKETNTVLEVFLRL